MVNSLAVSFFVHLGVMPVYRHIRLRCFGASIAGRVGVSVGAAISLRSPWVSVCWVGVGDLSWSFSVPFGLRW